MKNENTVLAQTPAPVAKKTPHTLTMHGVTRTDDYYWLNDRDNKEVTAYLKAENKYTRAYFDNHKSLYDSVYREIKQRVVKDDESYPYPMNGYSYYSKYSGNNEYAAYYRKSIGKAAKEQLLLDVNVMAEDKPYCDDAALEISPDNAWLAYSMDYVGRRKYTIYVRNIETGKDLPDVIANTTGAIVWASDNKTIFYTVEDEVTLRAYKVMRHEMGTPVANDVCVYEEKDETFFVDVERSKSGNYIFIHSISTTTTECLYMPADEPKGKFVVFEPRMRNHEYAVDEANGVFYIRTNRNAPNFKLVKTTPGKTAAANWKDVFVYDPNELTEDFDLLKNYLVVETRVKGLVKIKVLQLATNQTWFIEGDEEDYSMSIGVNEEFDTPVLRYYFGSLKTPVCELDMNLDTRTKTLLKQQKLNVPYNAGEYTVKRVYAKAADGVEIPVSVIYKTSLYKPGTNPCLVYGYGSYGVIVDPYFSGSRLSLLDRGFVFALAHVRGGEDLGRQWYEDGKLLHKKNTFTDFITCSKYLVEQKLAAPGKLFAQGGSAGGLLMGAIVNMAPALYKGIVAEVPFVDVVTTMLDSNIPLTTGEYDEWGNPNEQSFFEYMLSYSPYDNVQKTAYPAMLVTTGLHDSQVQYWEPAKWVAKLRAYKTDNNPLLLRTNMDAGHGGASGRFEGLKEVAINYTFILSNL